MNRDHSIPVVLWACAAFVLHAGLGGGFAGVNHVSEKHEKERAEVRQMVRSVGREFAAIDVEFSGPLAPSERKPEDGFQFRTALGPLGLLVPQFVEPASPPEDPKAVAESVAPPVVVPEPEKPSPKEPPPEPPPPLPPPKQDHRISIRQAPHAPEQDNPEAPRLAEQARTVTDETQARIRSTTQVTENPELGANAAGPSEEIGNGQIDRSAQVEDRPGDKKQAPASEARTAESPVKAAQTGAEPPGGGSQDPGGAAAPASAGSPGGGPSEPNQDEAGDEGWSKEVSPPGEGLGILPGLAAPTLAGLAINGRPRFGIGAGQGAGRAPNLDWQTFVASVGGEKALDQERARLGASIRSSRKGRLDAEKFRRMLPDIENYDPSVKLGNQTALNAAQSVFATYLSTIHNAIHPIFAEEFLGSLSRLGRGDVLQKHLVAKVEIVLSKADGRVVRRGITSNSESTIFDAAALDAIDRAEPFGITAPDAIVSPDGNVYLHWEFHRDPVDACSNRNASAYIVKNPKPIHPGKKKKPVPAGRPGTEATRAATDPTHPGPIAPLRVRPEKASEKSTDRR